MKKKIAPITRPCPICAHPIDARARTPCPICHFDDPFDNRYRAIVCKRIVGIVIVLVGMAVIVITLPYLQH